MFMANQLGTKGMRYCALGHTRPAAIFLSIASAAIGVSRPNTVTRATAQVPLHLRCRHHLQQPEEKDRNAPTWGLLLAGRHPRRDSFDFVDACCVARATQLLLGTSRSLATCRLLATRLQSAAQQTESKSSRVSVLPARMITTARMSSPRANTFVPISMRWPERL